MMWTEITQAEYLDGYRIKVIFNDGKCKVMDFTEIINKFTVFKPLQDISIFKNFKVTDTLEWQDGEIDIAPEYVMDHSVAMV